jgi:hypothetical protein
VLVAAVLALVGAPAALAIDADRVPEPLRAHPVAPVLDANHQPSNTQLRNSDLSPLNQPDYGSTAENGTTIRVTLNNDATAAGQEIDNDAAAVLPDDEAGQEALKECAREALWDILFDAGYDPGNFDLGSELKTASGRISTCILHNNLGIQPPLSDSIADWMMESVINHGAHVVTNDPSLAAFINWAGVTGWYSI